MGDWWVIGGWLLVVLGDWRVVVSGCGWLWVVVGGCG